MERAHCVETARANQSTESQGGTGSSPRGGAEALRQHGLKEYYDLDAEMSAGAERRCLLHVGLAQPLHNPAR